MRAILVASAVCLKRWLFVIDWNGLGISSVFIESLNHGHDVSWRNIGLNVVDLSKDKASTRGKIVDAPLDFVFDLLSSASVEDTLGIAATAPFRGCPRPRDTADPRSCQGHKRGGSGRRGRGCRKPRTRVP